jgi:integrase
LSSFKRNGRWQHRIYLGREHGKQVFYRIPGSFETKREADAAGREAWRVKPWEAMPTSQMTGNQLADRYLDEYAERHKRSSATTNRYRLEQFRRKFGDRVVVSITRAEAKDWARTVYPGIMGPVSAMFTWAIGEEEVDGLERNPFRGLSQGFGRRDGSDRTPPTLEELDRLRDACEVLGPEYGPRMRDLLNFAALTIMRPGELYELRYPDVDLAHNRIHVSRRIYKGYVDVPKNGAPKVIALVPPAREILLRQPTRTRDDGLVFVSQTGRQLSSTTLARYWQRITARAGLDCAFYVASKHLGVHTLYKLGLSERAIAAQAGWSVRSVEAMLDVYAARELTALAEVEALYRVVPDPFRVQP